MWRALPAAMLRFDLRDVPTKLGALGAGNRLRDAVWRERCASSSGRACADTGKGVCQSVGLHACRADTLIPVRVNGGGAKWKMASLHLLWRPLQGEARLLALGKVACEELNFAATVLRERCRFSLPEALPVATFADLVPSAGRYWRMNLVTPWVVDKPQQGKVASIPVTPDRATVEATFQTALTERAKKFSTLCANSVESGKLAAGLARYVTPDVVQKLIKLRRVELTLGKLDAAQLGNDKDYDSLHWEGTLDIEVEPEALPWVGLIAACGIGKNPDKGFGQTEWSLQSADGL